MRPRSSLSAGAWFCARTLRTRLSKAGVLNPAAVQHDGTTYLFYRAVALSPANYSRILIATTRLEPDGKITTTRLDRVAVAGRGADGRGGVTDRTRRHARQPMTDSAFACRDDNFRGIWNFQHSAITQRCLRRSTA